MQTCHDKGRDHHGSAASEASVPMPLSLASLIDWFQENDIAPTSVPTSSKRRQLVEHLHTSIAVSETHTIDTLDVLQNEGHGHH